MRELYVARWSWLLSHIILASVDACLYLVANRALFSERVHVRILHRQRGPSFNWGRMPQAGSPVCVYNVFERIPPQSHRPPHELQAFRITHSDDWLDRLADQYVHLRCATNIPLSDEVLDDLQIVDILPIGRFLARAVVPRLTDGGNLDIVRADLGEVLAYEVLEREYRTDISYKLVRDRELISLPGRGIDAIGAELRVSQNGEPAELRLVLVEVKVSTDTAAPPAVVDGSSTSSLRNQHRGHIQEAQATLAKVWLAVRNARETRTQQLLREIALRLERHLPVMQVACSVLVRPAGLVRAGDCGSFETAPGDYAPAEVRFLTIALPNDDFAALLMDWDDAIDRAIARYDEVCAA